MNLFDWIAGRGRRPAQNTAERGFENFGAESSDPSQDQYWRSTPHPTRLTVPTHGDWLAEILKLVHDHREGIDEVTGPFADPLIDAQAESHRIAARQHYPVQVRADQGLYAAEAGYLEQLRLEEKILARRIAAADADYRQGQDELLGTPGGTPAWDAGLETEPGHPLPFPVPAGTAPESPAQQDPADPGTSPAGTHHYEDTAGPSQPLRDERAA